MKMKHCNVYVAVHTPTGNLCLIWRGPLMSVVTFDGVTTIMTCEVGPISDFEALEAHSSLIGEVHE